MVRFCFERESRSKIKPKFLYRKRWHFCRPPPPLPVHSDFWVIGVCVFMYSVCFFFYKGQNVNNTGSYAFHFDLMTANGNDQNRRVTCPLFSSEMHIQIFKKKTRSNSPSQLSRPRTAGKSHEHLQFMIFKSCFWFPDEIFRLNVKVLTEGEILHVNTVRGGKKKNTTRDGRSRGPSFTAVSSFWVAFYAGTFTRAETCLRFVRMRSKEIRTFLSNPDI